MCSPAPLSGFRTVSVDSDPKKVKICRYATSSAAIDYTNIHWAQHYHQRGQRNKAQKKFAAALAHFTQTQDAVGMGKSLSGLGALSLAQARYDRALAYSQAAAVILEDTDAQYDYAIALYQLGVSHFELQHTALAEHCFETALKAFCRLSETEYENRALIYLGQIYAQQHKLLFALACYESVLDSLIAKPFLENMQDLLSAVFHTIGQLSRESEAGDNAIAAFQSILREYSLAAYHLQIASHLRPHG